MESTISIAYIMSRFPARYESQIWREVHTVNRMSSTTLTVFSLKPCRHGETEENTCQFLETTHYPSLGSLIRAIPIMFASPAARRCLRQVCTAYCDQPWKGVKAFVTLLLAA